MEMKNKNPCLTFQGKGVEVVSIYNKRKQMLTVSREERFCAGHRLVGDEGLCSNPHGHNYQLEVSVTGEINPETKLLVHCDYLKRAVRDLIEKVDHGFLVSSSDQELLDIWEKLGWKHVVIEGETSMENLVIWMVEEIRKKLKETLESADGQGTVNAIAAVLHETEKNSVHYETSF